MTPEPTFSAPDDADNHLSSARRTPSPPAQQSIEQRSRGGGAHLSDAAQDVILACIVRGDSNALINAALIKAGHLARGQSLSHVTLTAYRRDPRAKVQVDRLSQEAIQVAHVALSDSLVAAVEIFRASVHALFSGPARFKAGMSAQERNSLINALFKAVDLLWDRVGRDDLRQTVLRAEQATLDDLSKRDWVSTEERKEIVDSIQQQLAEMLRRVIARQDENEEVPPDPPDLAAKTRETHEDSGLP